MYESVTHAQDFGQSALALALARPKTMAGKVINNNNKIGANIATNRAMVVVVRIPMCLVLKSATHFFAADIVGVLRLLMLVVVVVAMIQSK